MALVEHTAGYLSDFGVTATIGGVATSVLFDKTYAEALGLSGASPAALLPTTSVGSATAGTAVVVGGISYTVAERHDSPADQPGWTRLMLEAV